MTVTRKFQNVIKRIEDQIKSIDDTFKDPYARYDDHYIDTLNGRREALEEALEIIFDEFKGELNK